MRRDQKHPEHESIKGMEDGYLSRLFAEQRRIDSGNRTPGFSTVWQRAAQSRRQKLHGKAWKTGAAAACASIVMISSALLSINHFSLSELAGRAETISRWQPPTAPLMQFSACLQNACSSCVEKSWEAPTDCLFYDTVREDAAGAQNS